MFISKEIMEDLESPKKDIDRVFNLLRYNKMSVSDFIKKVKLKESDYKYLINYFYLKKIKKVDLLRIGLKVLKELESRLETTTPSEKNHIEVERILFKLLNEKETEKQNELKLEAVQKAIECLKISRVYYTEKKYDNSAALHIASIIAETINVENENDRFFTESLLKITELGIKHLPGNERQFQTIFYESFENKK